MKDGFADDIKKVIKDEDEYKEFTIRLNSETKIHFFEECDTAITVKCSDKIMKKIKERLSKNHMVNLCKGFNDVPSDAICQLF